MEGDLETDIGGLSPGELAEHALALRTVLRVADAVHRSTDFADLAERAVDAIVQYTRYPSVALFRIDYAADRAELVSYRGFSPKIVEVGSVLPLRGSLTGVTVRTRTITTTHDLGADARLEPNTRAALAAEGFSDVACVPLFFRDDVIGCLNLIYKGASNLTAHERTTLQAIGKTIGLAMQNRIASEERRALQEHLVRTQQLESLGVLAGGIAHDFNNLLVGIAGNIALAKRAPASGEELPVLLDQAEQACLRGADLARQLLALSRGGAPLRRRTSDVATVVRDAAQLAVAGRDVACEVEVVGGATAPAFVDPSQLAQVVQNLVLNAAQASRGGGMVYVRLERFERAGGAILQLSVRDEGAGIEPHLIKRIFDPYFTTRGEGAGLGLPITHAIVERHGGQIHVESAPGRGTVFKVELPIESGAPEPESARPHALPVGARVLLVDDDAGVRQAGAGLLRHLGLDVTTAANSDEAVAAFAAARSDDRPFRGVILDLTMVGSEDGVQTLTRLRAIDPHVRALVSSGYSDGGEATDYARHGFVASLPKPYSLTQLQQALALLLSD